MISASKNALKSVNAFKKLYPVIPVNFFRFGNWTRNIHKTWGKKKTLFFMLTARVILPDAHLPGWAEPEHLPPDPKAE